MIDDVLNSYNRSHHRSIGAAPIDVTSENEDEIAKRQHPSKPPFKYRYDIGDRVRIAKYKHVFQKAYITNWTEIFTISDRYPTHLVTYGLGT
jgi:hypothetical protein